MAISAKKFVEYPESFHPLNLPWKHHRNRSLIFWVILRDRQNNGRMYLLNQIEKNSETSFCSLIIPKNLLVIPFSFHSLRKQKIFNTISKLLETPEGREWQFIQKTNGFLLPGSWALSINSPLKYHRSSNYKFKRIYVFHSNEKVPSNYFFEK